MLINTIKKLHSSIMEYSHIFSEYRYYLIGCDFPIMNQEPTNDPVQADKKLKELQNCLLNINKNSIALEQILNLNEEYSMDKIKIANDYLFDLAAASNLVHKRIHLLNEPDQLLIFNHSKFIEIFNNLNESIVKYNKNKVNTLFILK